jgi:hypothetical protein
MALSAPMTHADSLDTLPFAISGGAPNLELRERYEFVDRDRLSDNANALTLRTRLGYTTGKWNGLDAMAEYEGTIAEGGKAYRPTPTSTTNATFPVVSDPEGNELNQMFLRYTGLPQTAVKLGRQRLILDNARFIGNAGWRQNEITYDGVTAVNTSIPKTTITYAYLSNENNFTYGDAPMRTHLANAAFAPSPMFNLVGYMYLINFQQQTPNSGQAAAGPKSTASNLIGNKDYGARSFGAVPVGGTKLLYTLEYARQMNYGQSASTVSTVYYLIEPGLSYKKFTGKLGYEVLGSNGTNAFQTPLATLHAFQGWGDLFLTTPKLGIEDAYLSLGGTVEKVALLAMYHDFHAVKDGNKGGDHYGEEFDVQISRPITKSLSVLAKYADYVAKDSVTFSTQKAWLQLEYKF